MRIANLAPMLFVDPWRFGRNVRGRLLFELGTDGYVSRIPLDRGHRT